LNPTGPDFDRISELAAGYRLSFRLDWADDLAAKSASPCSAGDPSSRPAGRGGVPPGRAPRAGGHRVLAWRAWYGCGRAHSGAELAPPMGVRWAADDARLAVRASGRWP